MNSEQRLEELKIELEDEIKNKEKADFVILEDDIYEVIRKTKELANQL